VHGRGLRRPVYRWDLASRYSQSSITWWNS